MILCVMDVKKVMVYLITNNPCSTGREPLLSQHVLDGCRRFSEAVSLVNFLKPGGRCPECRKYPGIKVARQGPVVPFDDDSA